MNTRKADPCLNGCGRPGNYAKGLCPVCYHRPEIRARYPNLNRRGKGPKCLRCGRCSQASGRGICRRCGQIPGVREKYPSLRDLGKTSGGKDIIRSGRTTPMDWTNNPKLYPCRECTWGAAKEARGLCPSCAEIARVMAHEPASAIPDVR